MTNSHDTPQLAPSSPSTERPGLQVLMEALHSSDMDAALAAEGHLRNWVVEDPSFGIGFMGLGIALARRGEWTLARQHLEKAVEVSPKLAPAHTNLGNLYRQLGMRAEARAAYNKSIELQPNLADSHYNLAVILDEEGEAEAALESVKRALLFKPDYPEAHNNLGHQLIKAGKVEQALSHFRQALVWAPNLRPAAHNLILALYRLGRSVEAQAEVDRQLKERPDDTHILRVQAAGLMQQGRLNDAEAINHRLLTLEPNAADVHFNQGEVLLARQDYKGALAVYQDLIKQRRVPPALGIGAMANVMRAQGNFSEAKKLYQQALMMDGRLPPLVLGMGRTLLESGELKQALQTLRQAVQMLPHASDVHSLLIECLRLDPDTSTTTLAAEIKAWRHTHEPKAANARRLPHQRKVDEALRVGFLLGHDAPQELLNSLIALVEADSSLDIDLFFYQTGTMVEGWASLHDVALRWRPVATLGTNDLVEQIRQDAVDILIDTVGHGEGSRLSALTARASAVQIVWALQSPPPGTACIDHVMTHKWASIDDPRTIILEPPFFMNAGMSLSEDTPDESGEEGAIVLGCVAPLSHLNSQVLDTWAEILESRPKTRLRVFTQVNIEDTATRQRWVKLMLLRGIDADRISVEPIRSHEEMACEMRKIHLVLDSFPVSIGLSALNCLREGTPVLTLNQGKPWQGETAAVLGPLGLDEWMSVDRTAYVEKALEFIDSQPQSRPSRKQISDRLKASLVCNKPSFVEGFQRAMHKLWQEALTSSGSE